MNKPFRTHTAVQQTHGYAADLVKASRARPLTRTSLGPQQGLWARLTPKSRVEITMRGHCRLKAVMLLVKKTVFFKP